MKYKIIVDKQSRTNPSNEKREYEVNIEELRVKGDVYDSLVITKDEDYVIRRLSLSKYGILSILEEPIKETLENIDIELFEGDNYIYLIDMAGNRFYAEYLVKNDFNDIYATKNEMNSAINQTAQSIELTVNQKLTSYATNDDLEGEVTELNSKITQTANEITTTVSKKVGNDEIISKINQSSEKVTIDANKISLNGKEINLTSDNAVIKSNNFNVDKNGNMTCNNAIMSGAITSSNANITGGKLLLTGGSENDPVFQISANKGYTKIVGGYIWINGEYSPVNVSVGYDLNNYNSSVNIGSDSYGGAISVGNGSISNFFEVAGYDNRVTVFGPIYANSFNNNSKEELKKNIKLYDKRILETIKNSNIYQFNYKTEKDNEKKHIGFIIGDNYKTPDDVISQNEESIDTYSMTSMTWKAIQEQQELIEELQEKDKQKEEIMQDLIKRIENLEKEVKSNE